MTNNNIYEKLKAAKREKKLILFCGSGLSRNFKRPNGKPYPDWIQMVVEVLEHQFIKSKISDSERRNLSVSLSHENVLSVLNKIINEYGINEKIIKSNVLTSIFTPIEYCIEYSEVIEKFHSKLLYICENKVITTNYDNAFELTNPEFLSNLYVYDNENVVNVPSKGEFLLKLHGDIKRPESCVLTEIDYESLYVEEGKGLRRTVENALKPLLLTNSILFLGFSMGDIEIKRLFTYLKSLGSSDIVERAFFISTTKPEFGNLNFSDNWIKVEGDDISKAHENIVQEIFDYLNKDIESKSKENLIYIQKRVEALCKKEISTEFFYEDLERIFADTPHIFLSDSKNANEIFHKIVKFTIENKFYQNTDDFYVIKIFQKLNRFILPETQSENKLIVDIIQNILENLELGKLTFNNYVYKIGVLEKLISELKQVNSEYSNRILESNFLQNGIFTHIKILKNYLIGEFDEKQKPLQEFFSDYKKNRQVQKFSKISNEFPNQKIKVKDLKHDIINSNSLVDDYIFCKSGLISSMKYKPNIRLSLVTNTDKVAEGYIDKQLAFISIDADERKNRITESFLIERFHNKLEYISNFSIIETVSFFAKENMIVYGIDQNYEVPCIFVKDRNGDWLSYKDVLSILENSECKNDSFCNKTICEVFEASKVNFTPIDIDKVTFKYIEEQQKDNSGFLVRLSSKKIGFLHMASYTQWIRHFEGDLTPTMKIYSFHKEFLEKIQILDGKKSTFIIEPSRQYIFESFSESDTIFDLVRYFARPDTLDFALIEKQNSAYSIVSFREVFKELNNYFITL